MRLLVAVAFGLSFFACSHASPPVASRSATPLPELACRRTPAALMVPVVTQTARLSICAQLPQVPPAVESAADDDRYLLVFTTGSDGRVDDVVLLDAEGRPIAGRKAECFAGVMAQVELSPAVGGSCPASVPIRVARAPDTEPATLLASYRR